MADSKGMFTGVLVGCAVGAAAAMLLTPKSGRELRQDLCDKYRQTSGKAKKLVTDATEMTKEFIGHVGEKESYLADKAETAALSGAERAESAVRSAADQAETVIRAATDKQA